MNRKTTKAIALLVAAAMLLATFSMLFSVPGMTGQEGCYVYGAVNTGTTSADEASLDAQLAGLKTYLQYVKANYKDNVSYKTLVQGAYKGAMSSLDDPYSIYYATKEAENSFVQGIKGVFGGVGLVAQNNEKGECRILEVRKNLPAYRAGLKVDDWIVKVDGMDVTSLTGPEIIMKIRGEIGTSVSLTVNRGGALQDFTMVREEIKEDSVFTEILPDKIGYIEIVSFDNDGDLEFAQKREELLNQGVKALILDLRDNRGGIIDTAIKMVNQLTDKQVEILHYRQQDKIFKTVKTDGTGKASVPMIVLVNENTASAAEIFSAALQENKLATLVGTTTYGKGVAQQVSDLSGETGLKLSVYYFLKPSKQDIHKIGIVPDYVVKNPVKADSEELKAKYNGFAPMSEKKKYAKGETGLNVYGAQQRLALMGYAVKSTGTLDKDTETALKAFQKEAGLSSYGGLDYSTMGKLSNAVAAYISGTGEGDAQLDKAIFLLTGKGVK